jgi:hypothetical protein
MSIPVQPTKEANINGFDRNPASFPPNSVAASKVISPPCVLTAKVMSLTQVDFTRCSIVSFLENE